MLDRVIFFTLLPYFYDILDIIKYDCSRKSAKEILFMNKENRKAARERRAKEREHEAKVAHYKKIWSWAGPALIVVVIVGLIIASVLDSKRLSVKSASEDTSQPHRPHPPHQPPLRLLPLCRPTLPSPLRTVIPSISTMSAPLTAWNLKVETQKETALIL